MSSTRINGWRRTGSKRRARMDKDRQHAPNPYDAQAKRYATALRERLTHAAEMLLREVYPQARAIVRAGRGRPAAEIAEMLALQLPDAIRDAAALGKVPHDCLGFELDAGTGKVDLRFLMPPGADQERLRDVLAELASAVDPLVPAGLYRLDESRHVQTTAQPADLPVRDEPLALNTYELRVPRRGAAWFPASTHYSNDPFDDMIGSRPASEYEVVRVGAESLEEALVAMSDPPADILAAAARHDPHWPLQPYLEGHHYRLKYWGRDQDAFTQRMLDAGVPVLECQGIGFAFFRTREALKLRPKGVVMTHATGPDIAGDARSGLWITTTVAEYLLPDGRRALVCDNNLHVSAEHVRFMWRDGNWACDGNRILDLQREGLTDLPEETDHCTHVIKLGWLVLRSRHIVTGEVRIEVVMRPGDET